MAKRLTDTDKWKKQFVKSLSSELKLIWLYILDDCDIVGLWQVDWEVLQYRLGVKISMSEAYDKLKENVVILEDGEKWFLPSFIEFQYGPQLSKTNNIYKSIVKILNRYDLYQYLTIEIVEEGTTVSAYRGRLSRKTKEKIFLEADMICQYCGERKSIKELVVDHFMPLQRGGDNADNNLVCACVRCNSHKTDLHPLDFFFREISFLNPTPIIISLLNKLKGASKELTAPKDKDMVKVKVIGEGEGKSKELHLVLNVDQEKVESDLKDAFDGIYLGGQRMNWAHVDFEFQLRTFIDKVRGSPEKYKDHDSGGLRLAFQKQLREAKPSKRKPADLKVEDVS